MTIDRSALGSKRARVTGYVRLASIVLTIVGAAVASILYAIKMPYMSGALMIYGPPFAVLAGFAVPASLLASFSHRVARWLVPISVADCPACGYTLDSGSTQCPECGTKSHTSTVQNSPDK